MKLGTVASSVACVGVILNPFRSNEVVYMVRSEIGFDDVLGQIVIVGVVLFIFGFLAYFNMIDNNPLNLMVMGGILVVGSFAFLLLCSIIKRILKRIESAE